MLHEITFQDEKLMYDGGYDVIEFTDNTIILCCNSEMMNSLAEDIIKTVNGKAEYNDYRCDDEDVGKAKYVLDLDLQKIIDINGQRVTLGLEPSLIYKANKLEDIWRFELTAFDNGAVWPMSVLIGSQELWNSGKDEVYKSIYNSKYGHYDERWVNLIEDFVCDKLEEQEEEEIDQWENW